MIERITLVAILLAGLLLSLILYAGPYFSFDDGQYLIFAHQMLAGNFSIAENTYTFGFLMPASIAASFAVFGTGVPASILPSVLEYVAIVVVSYAVGRHIYGREAGLLGALLISIAPFIAGYTTRVLSDLFIGAVAGLAVYVIMYDRRRRKNMQMYFLAGALAGLTIYVKLIGFAFILFFLVALAVITLLERREWLGFWCAFAGVAVLLLLYALIFYVYTGNPLHAFVSYGNFQGSISPSTFDRNLVTMFIVLFLDTGPGGLPFGPWQSPQIFALGFIVLWAAGGTVIGLIRRESTTVCLSVILWGVFFYFFFGTISLTAYTFMSVISRYFALVAVPMAVLAGYMLQDLYRTVKAIFKKRVAMAVIAILLVMTALSNLPIYISLYEYDSIIANSIGTLYGVLGYVEAQHGSVLLVNSDNVQHFINFLDGYRTNVRVLLVEAGNESQASSSLGSNCTASSFLLLVFSPDAANTIEPAESAISSGTCKAAMVRSFGYPQGTSNIYVNSSTSAYLYRLGAG